MPSYSKTRTISMNLGSTAEPNNIAKMYLSENLTSLEAGLITGVPFTSPVSWTFNSDGQKTIYAQLEDFAGNKSVTISGAITVDTVYPEMIYFYPTDGALLSGLNYLSGIILDETSKINTSNFRVYLDNQIFVITPDFSKIEFWSATDLPYTTGFKINTSSLPDGFHQVSLYISDNAGNQSKKDYSFELLSGVPNVPTNLFANGVYNGVVLEWDKDNDNNLSYFELQCSGSLNNTNQWGNIFSYGQTPTVGASTQSKSNFFVHSKLESDTAIKSGVNMYYRIRSKNRAGTVSDWTNEVTATSTIIDSGDIAANAIYANHIMAGEINTRLLQTNELQAETIAAGTLNAYNVYISGLLNVNDIELNSFRTMATTDIDLQSFTQLSLYYPGYENIPYETKIRYFNTGIDSDPYWGTSQRNWGFWHNKYDNYMYGKELLGGSTYRLPLSGFISGFDVCMASTHATESHPFPTRHKNQLLFAYYSGAGYDRRLYVPYIYCDSSTGQFVKFADDITQVAHIVGPNDTTSSTNTSPKILFNNSVGFEGDPQYAYNYRILYLSGDNSNLLGKIGFLGTATNDIWPFPLVPIGTTTPLYTGVSDEVPFAIRNGDSWDACNDNEGYIHLIHLNKYLNGTVCWHKYKFWANAQERLDLTQKAPTRNSIPGTLFEKEEWNSLYSKNTSTVSPRIFCDNYNNLHCMVRTTENDIIYFQMDTSGVIKVKPTILYTLPENISWFDKSYNVYDDRAFTSYYLEPSNIYNTLDNLNYIRGGYLRKHYFKNFSQASLYSILQSIQK